MKKLISALTASAVAFGVSATTASAEDKPLYTDDSVTQISEKYIIGDINNDGELNISDMVVLNNYLCGKETERAVIINSDLNYDNSVDVFDLVAMRKYLLAPETAKKGTRNIDILTTAKKKNDKSVIAKSTAEVAAYLKETGADEAEIRKYLEVYDESFFKDNHVFLGTTGQKYGSGIHYTTGAAAFVAEKTALLFSKLNDFDYDDATNVYGVIAAKNYEAHPMLYPIKNNVLLFHYSIPASLMPEGNTECGIIDLSGLLSNDYSAYMYSSPNDSKSIYITQESYLLYSKVDVYYVNNDGSYTFAASLSEDDGCNPFDGEGKWEKDADSNDVFTNGKSYKLTWFENKVVIEHWQDEEEWITETIEFD